MKRQSRQVFGRIEPVRGRAARARKRLCAGWLLAVVALTGCLVTGNTDLPRPSDVPVVRGFSPPTQTRVPYPPDPDCAPADAMQFKVNVWSEDTKTDQVYLNVFANGNRAFGPLNLGHSEIPSIMRPTPALCVDRAQLILPCNVVEVVVADALSKVLSPADPADPTVSYVQWFVLGPSAEQADITRNSCVPMLNPDGGV
ncbi:MAG: hypothetical protein JWN04_914 [Myxococcaceae bacterium]|nr:hypothetical protein [Myxococcaceae bacterium]